MNKKIKIITIVFIFMFVSCQFLSIEDKIAYDIDQLLDHELNDIIKFTNGSDTLNFKIIKAERIIGYNGNIQQIEYITNQQGSYTISEKNNAGDDYIDVLRIALTGHVNEIPYAYNLKINIEEKISHVYEGNIVEYHEEYDFNGKTYKDVYEVLHDTINLFKPKVPYVMRAIPGGILKFYDSETKEMWELIE
jgi:hypothetical protein